MVWLELIAAAPVSGPVELAVVYGLSATAALYLGRTILRIFKPRRRPAGPSARPPKAGGCASCDKCGG